MLLIFLNSARKRRILPAKCQLPKLDYNARNSAADFILNILRLAVKCGQNSAGSLHFFCWEREFALSVVETTCLEETLFKVVRDCMRKTVE